MKVLLLLFFATSMVCPLALANRSLDRFTNQSVNTIARTIRSLSDGSPTPIDLIIGHTNFQIEGSPSTQCGPALNLFSDSPEQSLRNKLDGRRALGINLRRPANATPVDPLDAHFELSSGQEGKTVYSFIPAVVVNGDQVEYTLSFYKLQSRSNNGERPSGYDQAFSAQVLFQDRVTVPLNQFNERERRQLDCQVAYQAGGGLDDYNREITREIAPVTGQGSPQGVRSGL